MTVPARVTTSVSLAIGHTREVDLVAGAVIQQRHVPSGDRLAGREAEYVRHRMSEYLPDGVSIVVVTSHITLDVVANGDLPATHG